MEKAAQESFTLGPRHAGKRIHFNYFNLHFVSHASEKKISEKYLWITCVTEFSDFNFPQRQKENLEGEGWLRSNKTRCGEKYNIPKTRIVQFSFPLTCSAKPGNTSLFFIKQTIFMKSSDSLFVKFCPFLEHKSPNTIYTHLTLNVEF